MGPKKRANQQNSKISFNLIFSALTFAVVVILSYTFLFKDNPIIKDSKINSIISEVNLAPPPLPFFNNTRQTILLVGVDSNGKNTDSYDGTRSDTIILINMDTFSKTVNVISIPRDSKVYIANEKLPSKINSAHAFGGIDLTIKTIEKTFGITIDHYIEVNYNAIKEIVKALGGIKLNVQKRMRYTDKTAGLFINLYPGNQTLNPTQAEGYLRFRHDALGDIGRMKRQQKFIKALLEKFKTPDIFFKMPDLVRVFGTNVKTDLTVQDITQLAKFAQKVELSNIQVATLPGRPSDSEKISYWVLDANKCQKLIDRLIYREKLPKKSSPITLSLLYSKKYEDKIKELRQLFEEKGFQVVCNIPTSKKFNQVLFHSKYARYQDAKKLQSILTNTENFHFIIDLDGRYCGSSDFTIILGN